MKIGHIHPGSEIYGPGRRFVIWTQGCSIRCPGCWNQQFWDDQKGNEVPNTQLIEQIKAHRSSIEGITLLGGEPFDQPQDLAQIAATCQALGLSVVIYSGFTFEEIHAKGYGAILEHCDILIDGRFEAQHRDLDLTWRGSSNQRILFLSNRYPNLQPDESREIEIVLDEDGSETVYGYPENWMLRKPHV
jgi:anaerobic ribonucleoside-triphosphate reductase activating protein